MWKFIDHMMAGSTNAYYYQRGNKQGENQQIRAFVLLLEHLATCKGAPTRDKASMQYHDIIVYA